jgi:3-deoxy-7-phosphoheptulonate synthase
VPGETVFHVGSSMLVVMRQDATTAQIEGVVERIRDLGFTASVIPGRQRTAVGVLGNEGRIDAGPFEAMAGVRHVVAISEPYKQVSREWRPDDTVVSVGRDVRIGGDAVVVIAGPCSVESREQILETAFEAREAGASLLRGGAFKPRSSPYSFQGLGLRGLELLAAAREATGLAVVTEAVDPEGVEAVAEHADMIQIGARNMQNYSLLRRAGRTGKPILLKRGMAATVRDLLLSAEYLLAEGNPGVVLCERGIRGFAAETRNLLDLSAVPVIKSLSHLPVIVDPSHGTGKRALVGPMALAAIAAGADGVMVEVHPDPESALSDAGQALNPAELGDLISRLEAVAAAVGRSVALPGSPVVEVAAAASR